MQELKNRGLPPDVTDALLGRPSPAGTWELRVGETPEKREKLMRFLDTRSAKSMLLDFLRDHKVPRHLADRLLKAFSIPVSIPAEAMRVLKLGEGNGHPMDHPVFWGQSHSDAEWFWRRHDMPVVAVQRPDGSWECESATH